MLEEILNLKNQIILVECKECKANIIMLQNKNDKWFKLLSTQGFIGENGMGKKEEGDNKTPKGLYKLGTIFGINKNPRNNFTIYTNR